MSSLLRFLYLSVVLLPSWLPLIRVVSCTTNHPFTNTFELVMGLLTLTHRRYQSRLLAPLVSTLLVKLRVACVTRSRGMSYFTVLDALVLVEVGHASLFSKY